jgi:hypothetical protein
MLVGIHGAGKSQKAILYSVSHKLLESGQLGRDRVIARNQSGDDVIACVVT